MKVDKIYEKFSKCLTDDVSLDTFSHTMKDELEAETQIPDKVVRYDKDTINKMYKQASNNHKARNYKEAWPIFCNLASANHNISIFYLGYYHEKDMLCLKTVKKLMNITKSLLMQAAAGQLIFMQKPV